MPTLGLRIGYVGYKRCLAAAVADTIIGRSVLDTGSVRSMTATKAGRRVVPIPLPQQPLIEGAGGGLLLKVYKSGLAPVIVQ